MKKMLLLTMTACFLFALQAGAQEKAATQTKVSGNASVVPVKTTVTTQTDNLQNVSMSNRAPANSNVPTKTTTKENKVPVGNVVVTQKQGVSDIPEYINTGNPEKDMETLQKAKEEWILKNPDKYRPTIDPNK